MTREAGRGDVARRVAAAALVAAIAAPPLAAVEYIRRYAVTVPYRDELNFAVSHMDALHRGRLRFDDLASAYYSHPVLFSRSVYLALAWLTRYSNPTYLYVSWALLVVVAGLWFADSRAALCERPGLSRLSPLARLAWFVPAVWLLFSMRQSELFAWSMTLAEVLSLTGTAVAFFLLGREAERPGRFAAALASATAASLSTASGLLVWPIGCAYLVWIDRRVQGRPRCSWRPYGWGVLGLAMGIFYVSSLPNPLFPDGWATWGETARFLLAAAGAPLGWGICSATALGVILLAVQGLALISLLRGKRPTMAIPFFAFSLLNLGLMAVARGNLEGEWAPLQGRYTMFTTQGVVALHLWVAGWQQPPRPLKVARVALVALIAVTVCKAAVEAFAGAHWRRDQMRVYAYYLRTWRNQPRVILSQIFPRQPWRVREAGALFEELRFNVFAEAPEGPPAEPRGMAVGNLDEVNRRPLVGGTAVIDAGAEPACELRGWAIDPRSPRPARQVFLEVDQQRFAGLYRRDRPDVPAARNDASLRYTGFYVSFATVLVPPGRHQARLLVVADDGATFELQPFTLVVTGTRKRR